MDKRDEERMTTAFLWLFGVPAVVVTLIFFGIKLVNGVERWQEPRTTEMGQPDDPSP